MRINPDNVSSKFPPNSSSLNASSGKSFQISICLFCANENRLGHCHPELTAVIPLCMSSLLHVLCFSFLDQQSHLSRMKMFHFFISESASKFVCVSTRFCCDMGQNDTVGKIELKPSIVLSSDNTNCKNDIQLFHQLFDELSVHIDYH